VKAWEKAYKHVCPRIKVVFLMMGPHCHSYVVLLAVHWWCVIIVATLMTKDDISHHSLFGCHLDFKSVEGGGELCLPEPCIACATLWVLAIVCQPWWMVLVCLGGSHHRLGGHLHLQVAVFIFCAVMVVGQSWVVVGIRCHAVVVG
jgi:hypothetical protein